MTQETLTGKQVVALFMQDETLEFEGKPKDGVWAPFHLSVVSLVSMMNIDWQFRVKPKPQRRLSVTLANGEVVSWPEPVREQMEDEQRYWYVSSTGEVVSDFWAGANRQCKQLWFGNVHLTEEATQEHADALRRINTQVAV